MGVIDKELIESRYGRLWSGVEVVSIEGKEYSLRDLKVAFGVLAEDVEGIDILEMGEGSWAFRYYDGDDRCITVLEFDKTFHVIEEHRAHIAEWLGESYYDLGIQAFISANILNILHNQYKSEEQE
jgi:hypothetical protein